MSVIMIMIPAALLLAGLAVLAFILAAKSGQFDDLDTPAIRAIFDDDQTPRSQMSEQHKEQDQEKTEPESEDPGSSQRET